MTTTRNTSTRKGQSYYQQAAIWYRHVRQLRGCPFDAYHREQEALAYSLGLRSHAFIIPTTLLAADETGPALMRLTQHTPTQRDRFIELAARVVQVDDDDPAADEVHLLLEEPDRTSSRNRRHVVGHLPQEDAFWLVPLLRLETDAYGTGPILRFYAEANASDTAGDLRVVIARAHEAAQQWLDWKDERRLRFDEHYRSTYYDERAYATCEP